MLVGYMGWGREVHSCRACLKFVIWLSHRNEQRFIPLNASAVTAEETESQHLSLGRLLRDTRAAFPNSAGLKQVYIETRYYISMLFPGHQYGSLSSHSQEADGILNDL